MNGAPKFVGSGDSVGRTGFFRGLVFAPYKPEEQEVKGREQDESDAVGEREPVELVGDQATENRHGQRVCPQLASKKSKHYHDLDDAIDEEVGGHEVIARDGDVGGGVSKVRGDEFVGIFADLVLSDAVNAVDDPSWADEPERDPAEDLDQSIQALKNEDSAEKASREWCVGLPCGE